MMTMTISQALRSIKRTKGKLCELKTRGANSVSFDDSSEPTWSFDTVREEIAAAKKRLLALEAGVAVANATTKVSIDGAEVPIAYAIRYLQELKDDMSWLTQLSLREGSEELDVGYDWDPEKRRDVRRTKTITYVTKLNERDRAEELDSLRDRFERVNDEVEAANHRTKIKILEI